LSGQAAVARVAAIMPPLLRPIFAAPLLAAVLAIAACGDDESSAEKAQNQVCDARADIQKQVGSSTSLDQAASQISSAFDDLAQSFKQTLSPVDCS